MVSWGVSVPDPATPRQRKSALDSVATVVLSGLRSEGARFTSFDPTTAQSTPLTAVAVSPGVISLNLSATDYPNLLVVEERKTSAR